MDTSSKRPFSRDFYPRPPRGGRRIEPMLLASPTLFLSTPSARRATYDDGVSVAQPLFLSTPSARRATSWISQNEDWLQISIHALREEGDPPAGFRRAGDHDFYPRPPRGGRQSAGLYRRLLLHISIHALREEGDVTQVIKEQWPIYFYPRPPRGGRPATARKGFFFCRISIHALREEGDVHRPAAAKLVPISIHALREEGDGVSLAVAIS